MKKILLVGTILILMVSMTFISIAWLKGIRYPVLSLDPKPVSKQYQNNNIDIRATGAYFQKIENDIIYYRAYAPNIKFDIKSLSDNIENTLVVENIHPNANVSSNLVEIRRENLSRYFDLKQSFLASNASLEINAEIQFPKQLEYNFAVTGDTGGSKELFWTTIRAAQLGADFILNIGDINYQESDLHVIGDVLAKAPIPVYMAIRNHEFHEDGKLIYHHFQQKVGPLNTTFVLGQKRFINIDTAVDTIFKSRGQRGKLLDSIVSVETQSEINEYLTFTQRPLKEPLYLSDPNNTGEKNSVTLAKIDGFVIK